MTYLAIKLFVLSALSFVQRHWRLFAGGVLLLAALLLLYKACKPSQKPITIDEAALSKINSQNAQERKKQLEETIYDNAETVKTVDERTTISETRTVEMQKEVDRKVAEADRKIAEVKAKGGDVDAKTLECLLVPENCE